MVGGKCVWCLVTVVIFMGLGEAKRWECGFKVIICGEKVTKEGQHFLWEGFDPSRHHASIQVSSCLGDFELRKKNTYF